MIRIKYNEKINIYADVPSSVVSPTDEQNTEQALRIITSLT
jgi:hypothetical protein